MGKFCLILADRDADYIGSLSGYLMKHHSKSFDLNIFTDAAGLSGFFGDKGRMADILLAGPEFMDAGIPDGLAEAVILLDDGKGVNVSGIPAINRYQHAEKLVAAIFNIYSETTASVCHAVEKGSTTVTAFISPAGGAGKSLISAACSLMCSRRGLRAFYLNLEDTPSTGLYFNGESERDFSNVIYYLREKEGRSGTKLAGARCTDASSGTGFFLPPGNPLEMSALRAEDIKALIDSFRTADCDAVFIDMPDRLDERAAAVLHESDRIVCILGADGSSRLKLAGYRKGLDELGRRQIPGLAEKMVYALNEAKGSGAGNGCCEGVRPSVTLVECPALRNMTAGSNSLDFGADFNSGISGLLREINPVWALSRYAPEEEKAREAL